MVQGWDKCISVFRDFAEKLGYFNKIMRHCSTSRKVMVLIPDGVTGIFH
jgi:hypothetical protein